VFCDDFLLVADNVADINTVLIIVEDFEAWSGMVVNHDKCGVMAARAHKKEISIYRYYHI